MSEVHKRVCDICKDHFLAEAEWSEEENCYVSSPVCYECDAATHKAVDDILAARGHENTKPQWYDSNEWRPE